MLQLLGARRIPEVFLGVFSHPWAAKMLAIGLVRTAWCGAWLVFYIAHFDSSWSAWCKWMNVNHPQNNHGDLKTGDLEIPKILQYRVKPLYKRVQRFLGHHPGVLREKVTFSDSGRSWKHFKSIIPSTLPSINIAKLTGRSSFKTFLWWRGVL